MRSMAQTRACAKALRNALAWVMVLAGVAGTPAEEMGEEERAPKRAPTTRPAQRTTVAPAQATAPTEAPEPVDWAGHINAAMTASDLGTIYREACKSVPAGQERTRLSAAMMERKALIDRELGIAEPAPEEVPA